MFKFPHLYQFITRWRKPRRKESQMYLNTLTNQAQASIAHAFQVTENSAQGLNRLIQEASNQGAGGMAREATQLVQNAQVAIQAVKAVLESPHGQVAQGAARGSNAEVRALAQELLRKLG